MLNRSVDIASSNYAGSDPKLDNNVGGLHEKLLNSKVGEVIRALDTITEILGNEIDLSFPQIVVAGEESSGKSSVLERIAMFQFFPRAEQICTRMPLKLLLKHLSKKSLRDFCRTHNLEYGEDGGYVRLKYESGKGENALWSQFFHLEEVESQVKFYMDEAVKARKGAVTGVVDDILSIEVYSNLVPNLTLVDLPGIFSAIRKEEASDLPQKTKELVASYLKHPHTLILAIVRSTSYIRNSQAMQLIQEYKKENFTLGVVTMAEKSYEQARTGDHYYELKRILDGTAPHCIELPYGYVAVKNRDTTLGNQTLREAAQTEASWFDEAIPGYREKGKASSGVLINKLSSMLCHYVSTTWAPFASKKITDLIAAAKAQINALGSDPAVEPQKLLNEILEEFYKEWTKEYNEDGAKNSASMNIICGIVNTNIPGVWTFNQTNILAKVKALGVYREKTGGLAIPTIPREVVSQLKKTAVQICEADTMPLRLKRFANFKNSIIEWIDITSEPLVQNCIARLENELFTLFNTFGFQITTEAVIRTFQIALIEEIIFPISSSLSDVEQMKEKFPPISKLLLEQDLANRIGLQNYLKNLESVLVTVQKLSTSLDDDTL